MASWLDYLNPRTWFSTTPSTSTVVLDENSNQWGIPITGEQLSASLGLGINDKPAETPLKGIYNAGAAPTGVTTLTPDIAAAALSSPTYSTVTPTGLTALQQQAGINIDELNNTLAWGRKIGTAGLLADLAFKGFGAWNAYQAAKEAARQNERSWNLAKTQANNNIRIAQQNLRGRANNETWFSGYKSDIDPNQLTLV